MTELDPGHVYQLNTLDGDVPDTCGRPAPLVITYVKREGPGYPGNVGHHPGTTLQEGWRAEIKRLLYLDNQEHHYCNLIAIENLRQNIKLLEMRAAERHNRPMPQFWANVEDMPVCRECNHIGCQGGCHR